MVPLIGNSQDLITFSSGEKIEAKVKEVGDKTISYYKFHNQTGPVYTKDINLIYQIKYQNGETETYNKNTVLKEEVQAISDSNPTSLLAKGNNVFVEIPDDAARAGERYFVNALKNWAFWNVVEDKNQAHFIIQFNLEKKIMLDKKAFVVFKTRDNKEFKKSKEYRSTTNAFNGYNAFKGVAEKVVDKYFVSGEFKK